MLKYQLLEIFSNVLLLITMAMFSYKLLNGEGGMFHYSDTGFDKNVTVDQACEYLRKKHEYLQKDKKCNIYLIKYGKIMNGNDKLIDHKLHSICCVHVIARSVD